MADGTLDSSIILGGKAPVFENPIDVASKAMAFKALASKNQIEGLQTQQAQQTWNDEQTLRNAKNSNMTINPDGTASLNTQGMVNTLGNSDNPSLAIKAQQDAAATNLALQNQKIEQQKNLAAYAGQVLGGVSDQQSYDMAKQKADAVVPGASSKWPTQFDPSFVKSAQYQAMSAHDALDLQQKQQEMTIKEKQFQETQHTAAFEGAIGALNSTRQTPPDVQQAKMDNYNSQKVMELYKGDPNKLSPQLINLGIGEVSKIAAGKSPTDEEYKMISAPTANKILAESEQYVTNHPEASKQGAFVNVLRNYVGMIQKNAQSTIGKHVDGVIGSYAPRLTSTDRQNLIDKFASKPDASPTTKSNDDDSDDYAVGTTGKTKSGTSVVYKGKGVWAPQ